MTAEALGVLLNNPEIVPVGGGIAFLAVVTGLVTTYRKFRTDQVTDWGTLLERSEHGREVDRLAHAAEVARLTGLLDAARVEAETLRTASNVLIDRLRQDASDQYDRAEAYRRQLGAEKGTDDDTA